MLDLASNADLEAQGVLFRRPGPKGFLNMDPGALNFGQSVMPPSIIPPQGAQLEHPLVPTAAESGQSSFPQDITLCCSLWPA